VRTIRLHVRRALDDKAANSESEIWIVSLVALLLAGFGKGLTRLGQAMVAIPLMMAVVDVRQAPAIAA
jgi:uncharacterized membrane protein YfcA